MGATPLSEPCDDVEFLKPVKFHQLLLKGTTGTVCYEAPTQGAISKL